MEEIKISKEEYDTLIQTQKLLWALEVGGVRDWDGFDFTLESLGEK